MNLLAQLVRDVGDVVFPRSCVHCRKLVEDGQDWRHLCVKCVTQIEFIRGAHCTTCGHPFYGEMAENRMCPHCVGLEPAFREGRTAALFKDPARALLIELKYHQGLQVLSDMEEAFRRAPEFLAFVRDATLVPVPLHPRKERERGYNQSALLAERLARAAGGGTTVAALLRRTVDTQTQTAFDRRTRQANLKNAFALVRRGTLNPGLHYILVDDVFTTGSTLNGCARVLRRGGCLNLDVVTFGHG